MISCATGCGGVGESSGRGSGLGCSIGAVSCGAGVACSGRLASARRIDADNALGSINVASITGPRWISSAWLHVQNSPKYMSANSNTCSKTAAIRDCTVSARVSFTS